ncbi:hypothetical protein, partial [Salmonella sp. s60093]|uniref:hypothetical protein n=1 Tax=Salmonella sp. s60093 TaxID=3159721 RepID=UPI00397F213C
NMFKAKAVKARVVKHFIVGNGFGVTCIHTIGSGFRVQGLGLEGLPFMFYTGVYPGLNLNYTFVC